MASLSTLVQMVANDIGVTLLPEISLNVEIRDDCVALVPFEDPQPSRKIGMAWRKTSPGKKFYMTLVDVIAEVHVQLAKTLKHQEFK